MTRRLRYLRTSPTERARAARTLLGRAGIVSVAVLAWLAPYRTTALAREAPLAMHCAEFAGAVLSAELIALPTAGAQIESAAMIGATAPGNQQGGEYCRITGRIKALEPTTPDIRFDLNLPRRWNGRALQIGGGGYNGVVVSGTGVMPFSPDRAPLAQGYATFGDDSGHVGDSSLAVFGLVDEAVTNFGYAHLKKTHDVALALIARAYGRPPQRMYFAGGSTGGREGYTVMQRFPDDYDGVIANSPALNFSGVRLLGVKLGQAEYGKPGGFVAPALLERVYQRTLAVCDRLDGAADGIVSDVDACRTHEADIIDSLRCPLDPGASATALSATSPDACLNDAQLATLLVMRDGLSLPYRLAWDVSGYRGYNVFQGTQLTGSLGLAHQPQRLPVPAFHANGYLFAQGDGYIRYFVARDPQFDSLRFDPQRPGKYRAQLIELSHTIGAMNPDLSRYIARGGKLITLQGLADEVISPNQTIAYHDALVARFGVEAVDGFMRLYMVPGFQHGSGVFIPSVDLLGALDNWVTRGVAPETLTATDIAAATNGRSRPLCRYPRFPRYAGKGNLNLASSFICAQP
ncbi:tannase/feruloyl esterase family alpha/beta hydrolase [Paraburkholderia sp. MMS20-SJTR3]|uniref:Tannase/feruloyl esterase family alpha/beta hydrolase n=1 Tax=Paraburkholderia sejongensis TaxID=2886946 RepID=A0ABS8JY75_9BURK|nr:tannase/feruloyl esterase family alpha/beta hydrolase [Paraburkholderia sp. MMS20-SJTR3]MCC8394856.1 tannase/feruloyl esterase family alpha/beta hydrolase [Paraburkholderia sp. MMS20-SJTR3]